MNDGDSTSLLYDFEHARHKRDTETHPVAQQAWALRCADLEREIAVRNARATQLRDTPRIESAGERLTTEQIVELKAQLPKYTVAVSKKLSAACETATEFFDSDERTVARTLIAAWISATDTVERAHDALNEAHYAREALIKEAL